MVADGTVSGDDKAAETPPHPRFDLKSTQLRRLFVEDAYFVKKGDHFLLAVAEDHPSFSSTWKPLYEKICELPNPPSTAVVSCNGRSFYPFDVTVTETPHRSELHDDGQLTKSDFVKGFNYQQGKSFNLHVCALPLTKENELQVKYAEILISKETFPWTI